jgi:hypothetical protein
VLLAAAAGFTLRGCPIFERPVTLTSLSPDDRWRVVLVERPAWIDRNFTVRLEDIDTGSSRVVFRSPDEGGPVGSERVVWSADGSKFLLLGRYFVTDDAGQLPTGEQAYLLMDVRSGQIWCNSPQQSQFPNFDIKELHAIKWLGWSAD